MSEAVKHIAPPSSSSFKMILAMVSIGTMCALLIVLTYEGTLPRVTRLKEEALKKAVFHVIPGTTKTMTYQLSGNTFAPSKGEKTENQIYAGFDDNGNLKGLAIAASGHGYADVIKILYGYSIDKQAIIGFYVLESKETPGLGDKIEKDPTFLANFDLLDVSLTPDFQALNNFVVPVKHGSKQHPWEVDGITGATISSRAIGNMLSESSRRLVPLIYQQREDFKLISNDE